MEHLDQLLEKYANLVIRVGINVQKGQTVIINANLDSAPFVRELTRKAYEAGAKHVLADWDDEGVKRIRFESAPEESFAEYPMWKMRGIEEILEQGGSYIQVYAPNPELLKGIPADRVAAANLAAAKGAVKFHQYIGSGHSTWAMASVPTPDWAAKVFPGKSPEDAAEALWDSIFKVTRVYEGDPVQAWKMHIAKLGDKMNMLNEKRYSALVYRSPGTNLRVELPENHLWTGGDMPCERNGTRFVPNFPTEEVFTLPRKDGVSGTVSSTLPLNYQGNVIDRFTLTFEKGRIVDFTAEEGYDILKKLIETDEGSHYLGEVALVPHHSPVSDLGVIFYNTIFDENASCHLAIGKAYPLNLKDGVGMSPEELARHGANDSLVHVDFMMGSPLLDIDGERADGTLEPLFRQGNWA